MRQTSLPDLAQPTPLVECPTLARRLRVPRILAKLESQRPLGNFKSLGGMVAGSAALARAAERTGTDGNPPALICASDGNHGLAVAAAARAAGAGAIIFLHRGVEQVRAARIEEVGAQIRWVEGTYDDAVADAAAAALGGEGILVPDTSPDPRDPVVADVMRGYARIADEVVGQLPASARGSPLHLYVQAGVGGLAAAMADGLTNSGLAIALRVVEPEAAACVAHALATGRVERIAGDLKTTAEMLSCGLASAAAVEVLRRHGAQSVVTSESLLAEAVLRLEQDEGILTTPSGAAGLAGLLASPPAGRAGTILLIITEGPLPS